MKREKRGSDLSSSQLYSILATDGLMVGSHPYSLFSLSGNNVDIHEHKETVDWEERKKKYILREKERRKKFDSYL